MKNFFGILWNVFVLLFSVVGGAVFLFGCVILGLFIAVISLVFIPFVISALYHFAIAPYLLETFGYSWLNPPLVVLFSSIFLITLLIRIFSKKNIELTFPGFVRNEYVKFKDNF